MYEPALGLSVADPVTEWPARNGLQRVASSGQKVYQLPVLTLLPNGNTLEGRLRSVAADTLDDNWYDNEGGYRTVTFYPLSVDPTARSIAT